MMPGHQGFEARAWWALPAMSPTVRPAAGHRRANRRYTCPARSRVGSTISARSAQPCRLHRKHRTSKSDWKPPLRGQTPTGKLETRVSSTMASPCAADERLVTGRRAEEGDATYRVHAKAPVY